MMHMVGRGRDVYFSHSQWRRILTLASLFGWHPGGTVLNEGLSRERYATPGRSEDEIDALVTDARERWDGTYFGNLWQTVTTDDAGSLADALEASLPHIADSDVLAVDAADQSCTGPLPWFQGRQKDTIRRFIAFCRRGRFQIG